MKKYELITILRPAMSDSERNDFAGMVKKMITEAKGTLDTQEEIGKRELTFPIKKQTSGYYLLFNFQMGADRVSDFERKIRQHELTLRHLLIVKEE